MTDEMLEKVRRELARYEHPLFDFAARPAREGVEVEIRYKLPKNAAAADVHDYIFQLRPREIENTQFPWTFQKQLYDCLHDYIIEMFTRNPQRVN
ncbi:MAG: hypothetical protein WCA38_12080 [Candidatus Acidiferrales bacterium]